jgi:phage FluMu protein Com
MPIRFRCAYCNQLLGIARRKAGTVVRCPGCAGQVVVPSLEEAGLAEKTVNPQQVTAGPPKPFEGNDIDRVLEGADEPSVVQPGGGPVFASQAAGPPGSSVGAGSLRSPGIWLSPARATLFSVVVVVALAVAFGLGLMVGLMLHSK